MKARTKSLLVLVIPFIILGITYFFLPARIPRQFHLNGEPPTYAAKEFIFLFGFLPFLIYQKYRKKE
ncbi:MAG: DUF1648 domain-containing protein [Clostridiaceae bacterium]|nr:DUF1648 domain-containing protein [Clostridiaceae bacterium]